MKFKTKKSEHVEIALIFNFQFSIIHILRFTFKN